MQHLHTVKIIGSSPIITTNIQGVNMENILKIIYFLTLGACIRIYYSRVKNETDQFDHLNILSCAVATIHIVLGLFSILLLL